MERRIRQTMTIRELRDHVARLSPEAKISDLFEQQRRRDSESRKVWYRTQQEHLLGWLNAYDGPGFYGRRRWDRDARFVYNHFQCPQGLLWLAEAAGVAAAKITEANEAVVTAPPRLSSQVGALRRVIPWSLVEAGLNAALTSTTSDASPKKGGAAKQNERLVTRAKEKTLRVVKGGKIALGTEAEFEMAAGEIIGYTGGSSLGGAMSMLWGILVGDTTCVSADVAEQIALEATEFKTLFGANLSQRANKLLDRIASLSPKPPTGKQQAAPQMPEGGEMSPEEKASAYEEVDRVFSKKLAVSSEPLEKDDDDHEDANPECAAGVGPDLKASPTIPDRVPASRKRSTRRHIIVGDIHGELEGFKEILAHAALIDAQGKWSGKDAVLVQTGDVIDRGPHSVESVQFLRGIQTQAATVGGQVVRLCGNHELLLLQGDWRYTNFADQDGMKRQLAEEILGGKLLAAYTDGTRLYTHAGLRTSIREKVEAGAPVASERKVLQHLADRLNRVFVAALKTGDIKTHAIFHVDKERGGRHEVGGIFWGALALLEGSLHAYDVAQVFGHTTTRKSGVKHSHGLQLIDVDAGMFIGYGGNRVYLEIDASGALAEHALKQGKWRRTVLPEKCHS